MNVAVTATSAGRLTLNVFTDRLVATQSQDVKAGSAQVQAERRQGLGHRRLSGRHAAPSARCAGAAHARPRHRRAVVLDRPHRAHARRRHEDADGAAAEFASSPCRCSINGLASGEEARIVVAAVDVGILNLTNYKPPAPDDYYLGQRRLTADIRDLYGQLIDGMQGARGAIRSGGDAGGGELTGSPPTQPPLALYSGIVARRLGRQRAGDVRHSGLRRHRARDGGGLEQG